MWLDCFCVSGCRVSFEGEQHERRNLAEVQQAASPQKDGPAQQGTAASSRYVALPS